MDDEDASALFNVVLNGEEQYSLWPAADPLPVGWRVSGFTGTSEACLAHIEAIWTDMRPLSVRRFMSDHAGQVGGAQDGEPEEYPPLAARLSAGEHPVEVESGDLGRLRDALDRRLVHVRFTGTAGGTDLMIWLDPTSSDLAQRGAAEGQIRIVGDLVLDGSPARCIASVALPALTGTGHLELAEDDLGDVAVRAPA